MLGILFIPVPVLLLVHDGTRRSKKVASVKLELWNLVVLYVLRLSVKEVVEGY
jgi:hypothetical protein